MALLATVTIGAVTLSATAPVAGAVPPVAHSSLEWAPGTPALLTVGDTERLRVSVMAADPASASDTVVRLQLSNSTAGRLPAACEEGSGDTPSAVSADGLRIACNLGPLSPGATVEVDLPIVVGGDADVVAAQEGDYDDQGTVVSRRVDATPGPRYYRLLSSPDFLNADIADLREARLAYWKPGMPNSWNTDYEQLLTRIVDDWASFGPDAVTVPGDLVNGRWIKDQEKVAMFGPVGTPAERARSIRRAGTTYFRAWRDLFVPSGLRVYPGIGDHDLGDNPWSGSRLNDEKRAHAPLFRKLFAQTFTQRPNGAYRYPNRPKGTTWEGTAYAVRPHPEVQLVMLDVFRTVDGNVRAQVSGGQLAWLERVLSRARADGVDWIVVEGHTPILGPVRLGPSSGLMYRDGRSSRLWSLFQEYGVDAYLSGEVHASTAIVSGGVAQVSHGGNVGFGLKATSRGGTSFVVSDFSSSGLTMHLYSWDRTSSGEPLWQMAGNRIDSQRAIVSGPIEIGSLTLTNDGSSAANRTVVVDRTGLLARFDPATEPGEFAVEHLPGG